MSHPHPYAIKVLASDDDTYVVGGYGVVFDGRDLAGDYFTRDSDLWLDRLGTPIVLYSHGMDPVIGKSVLGRQQSVRVDDVGVWVETQLRRSAAYVEAIRDLVERGVLGYSSGAIAHLVERAKSGWLRSWPVIEWSLTPEPAEPRTVGLTLVKHAAGLGIDADARGASGLAIRAVWSTAYVNDLPDSAFLYIEPGGEKDETGRTVPRRLRHFPYRDSDGAIDLPHLRNALARIPQSNLPADVQERLTRKARQLLESATSTSENSENKAGRVMSARNQEQMHAALRSLTALHGATCDMGSDCPMSDRSDSGASASTRTSTRTGTATTIESLRLRLHDFYVRHPLEVTHG